MIQEPHKILVADDDAINRQVLADLLKPEYTVLLARDGGQALERAARHAPDLILLDVMMPEMDGWTVMKKLGARTKTPVLFLSARGTLEDRLKGLDLGADDYLVKPFSFAELLARIRIILRRGQPQKPDEQVFEVGDLRVDVPKRRVDRAGVRITLTNKEFNLLAFFLEHQGQVLSRALIASRVWDMNFDSDSNVVDVAVRRLRQKIDDPFPVRLIHTIHGVGYRFEYEA